MGTATRVILPLLLARERPTISTRGCEPVKAERRAWTAEPNCGEPRQRTLRPQAAPTSDRCPMLRPAFMSREPLQGFLRTSDCGDVIAARTCAHAALAKISGNIVVLHDARLLLTAACLSVVAQTSQPRWIDVVDLLKRLGSTSLPSDKWGATSMQFLQYVGAELAEQSPELRTAAIDMCLAALRD